MTQTVRDQHSQEFGSAANTQQNDVDTDTKHPDFSALLEPVEKFTNEVKRIVALESIDFTAKMTMIRESCSPLLEEMEGRFETFTVADGLAHEIVYDIARDDSVPSGGSRGEDAVDSPRRTSSSWSKISRRCAGFRFGGMSK